VKIEPLNVGFRRKRLWRCWTKLRHREWRRWRRWRPSQWTRKGPQRGSPI